jgi:hypothetical protein
MAMFFLVASANQDSPALTACCRIGWIVEKAGIPLFSSWLFCWGKAPQITHLKQAIFPYPVYHGSSCTAIFHVLIARSNCGIRFATNRVHTFTWKK